MAQNVIVCCRFRPANKNELSTGDKVVAVLDATATAVNIHIDNPSLMDELGFTVPANASNSDAAKLAAARSFPQFNFDHVFGWDLPQDIIYEKSAKPLVKDIFAGYNT